MVDISKDKYLTTMLIGFFCLQPFNIPMSDVYIEEPTSPPISRLGLILNYTQNTMVVSFFISLFIVTMIILFTDCVKPHKNMISMLLNVTLSLTNFLLLLAYIYYIITNKMYIYEHGLILSATICGVVLPLSIYVTYEYIMAFNIGNIVRELLFASFNVIKPLLLEVLDINITLNTIILTKLVIMVIISIISTFFFHRVYLSETEKDNAKKKGKATTKIKDGIATARSTSDGNSSGTNTPSTTSNNGNTNAINASSGDIRKGSSIHTLYNIHKSSQPIMMAMLSNLVYLFYPGIIPYSLITTDLAITLDAICIALCTFVSLVLYSLCYNKNVNPATNWDEQPQWQYAWVGLFPIIIVGIIFILGSLRRHLLDLELLNKLFMPVIIMLVLSVLSSNLMLNIGLSGCGSQVEDEYKDKMTVFGVFVYYGSLFTCMTIFQTYLTRNGYGIGVGLPIIWSQSNDYPSDTVDQDMIVFTRM